MDPADESASATRNAELACVVLAHDQPDQLHRLLAALDPLPVFLHVDARTPDPVAAAMTRDLPERVRLLPRVATAWATFGAVQAELAGYRAAVAETSATHVALLSGSDYPLLSTADLRAVLTPLIGRSITYVAPLPIPQWGMSGGLGRLRYYHWAWRRHVIRLPIPRRLPRGLSLAGGPTQKVLAREHADAVVRAVDRRPELVRFWRRAWAPDETFVATLLSTPSLVPGYADHHLHELAWLIDWRQANIKGPPWLTMEHLPFLQEGRTVPAGSLPKLFARKFHSTLSAELLDAVDALRQEPLRTTPA
ncbi:beta-1,6-N-acetylglucosaminyltransferase [Isoptericola sp. b490]|uniref:beta-1,6-N-acetylglucosaminyltransferase n=1 Tax=Actinotalea lenta TaxID=3064654 RepID=UPI002712EF24|nr:beta-1,6-N-acetylglucosaminyltransferase [Isoptericola sp. b490]MDO8122278.1 beta-1,6-N-acetylglucosaminyltransferase [Isoptericola sp. b490]